MTKFKIEPTVIGGQCCYVLRRWEPLPFPLGKLGLGIWLFVDLSEDRSELEAAAEHLAQDTSYLEK